MASALYSQLPLNPSNSEIRTLIVLPSDNHEAPIICSLNVASINDDCDFEALSYVWHEPSLAAAAPVTILVNGNKFTPTPNLFSALQHLRLPQKARKLWIDAICINQGDLDERSAQVSLMTRIYTRAQAVAVWLGPSNDDIDKYARLEPQLIADIGLLRESFSHHFQNLSDLAVPEIVAEIEKLWLKKHLKLLELLPGYFSLIGNEYWSRMWTYQESCLPATSRSFYCGSNLFTWEQVGYKLVFSHFMSLDCWHRCLVTQRNRSGGESYLPNERQRYATSLARHMGAYFKANPHQRGSFSIPSDHLDDFAVHLMKTTYRICMNPLDRFYALYGLVPNPSHLPRVDYTRDVHTVAANIASYLISSSLGARLFDKWDYGAPRALTAPSNHVWPSWVPDFRVTTPLFNQEYEKEVQASLRNKIVSISRDLSTIMIQGKSFGPCKVVARFKSTTSGVELFARGLGQILASLAPGPGLEAFHKNVERLITLFTYPLSSYGVTISSVDQVVGLLLHWRSESLKRLAEGNSSPEDMQRDLSLQEVPAFDANNWKHTSVGNQTDDKVLFVTDDLHMGFGNAHMRDGDILARLGDQRGSCVLRRCETGSPGSPWEETVTMIGPSAVRHLPLFWNAETRYSATWCEDMTVDKTEPVVFTIR
ncbi:heterokaryon incompatibility protein-domain-containing protein [Plectosphaerella cucumerina]|uniref:Heterokaryon incompatibility protein-domain-containing protein n=1 Tax=Plectosphaerella cucumerina TaxID=40658 RepID=A0A8K0TN14_9PEZI|nr:heterokaryon incompatibility protein-domain-containing protein [Plectosphaerella cucumerina]